MARRALTATVVLLLLAGLVFVVRVLGCRHPRDAASPRGAVDAFYAGCLDKPTVSRGIDEGSARAGTVPDDPRAYHHLVEYSVEYDNDDIRFLIVGRRTPDSAWRAIGGEGTGP